LLGLESTLRPRGRPRKTGDNIVLSRYGLDGSGAGQGVRLHPVSGRNRLRKRSPGIGDGRSELCVFVGDGLRERALRSGDGDAGGCFRRGGAKPSAACRSCCDSASRDYLS
jgi:hypothetical protein